MSPVNFIFLRGSISVIYYYFFFLLWQFLLHSYELFPINYSARNIYVWNHCEYSDHAIQVIILSHLWRDQTCKLRFFYLIILWFLLFFATVAFLPQKKRGERDVSQNKLFQVLGRVYTSLQNRCFMSQARKTRHFGRSVRRGEEKNKAAVTSPLFWLLLWTLCLY